MDSTSSPRQRSVSAPSDRSWQVVDLTMKTAVDVFFSVVGLILSLPIMIVIAILIRVDSKGPVVFKDWRLGRHGARFNCYKFRTMYVDGDRLLSEYLASAPEAQAEWEAYKKLRVFDPRVTRVGTWLRSLSLDELPQLWNVVCGQMSLVGPRPYLLREYDEMGPLRDIVLSVQPGITGLWQVSGRNELSFRQRVRLEAWYARHRSFFFDFILLLRTVFVVLKRRGAS